MGYNKINEYKNSMISSQICVFLQNLFLTINNSFDRIQLQLLQTVNPKKEQDNICYKKDSHIDPLTYK